VRLDNTYVIYTSGTMVSVPLGRHAFKLGKAIYTSTHWRSTLLLKGPGLGKLGKTHVKGQYFIFLDVITKTLCELAGIQTPCYGGRKKSFCSSPKGAKKRVVYGDELSYVFTQEVPNRVCDGGKKGDWN